MHKRTSIFESKPERSASRSRAAPVSDRASARERTPSVHLRRVLGNDAFGRVLQAKLKVNEPDDVYEREADRVADQVLRMHDVRTAQATALGGSVVQRVCTACRDEPQVLRLTPSARAASDVRREVDEEAPEEEVVRRRTPVPDRADDEDEDVLQGAGVGRESAGRVAPDVARQIEGLQGGRPLSPSLRSFFEPRFGYDFGGVRVHTDARAAETAGSIGALAYTTGRHIVFGEGQFAPESDEGRHLIAHELTHVVQQNAGPGPAPLRQRDGRHAAGEEPSLADRRPAGSRIIQRRPFFFAPPQKPSGTLVHNEVLPMFIKVNDDLFIEAPIPGANKKDPDKNAVGRADFYKATATGGVSRTIGIKFKDDDPAFLSGRQIEWGGGAYSHRKNAAPQGKPSTPKVRKLAVAPTQIYIGDLKPGFSSESFLAQAQINHYRKGITNTANDVNTYVTANPSEADSATAWSPSPETMSTLTIPSGIAYPNGTAFPGVPLALYEEQVTGVKRVMSDTSLRGRLFVYKDDVPGVWSYEWIPQSIPAATGSGRVNTVLDRLNNNVIPAITEAPGGGATARRKAAPAQRPRTEERPATPEPVRARTKGPIIQRTRKRFNDRTWKRTQYTPWKKEADKFLGDEKEVEKATVAHTLLEVEDRSGLNLGVPKAVKERGKGLDKIRHWKRFGSLYGLLREKFGFLFERMQRFVRSIKRKMARLSRSSRAKKFGTWVKAAAQVIFKIFKLVGAWVVRTVVDKLVASLQEGLSKNLSKLVESFTPEAVTSKVEEFNELKEKYQQIIDAKQEELTTFLFGDRLAIFDQLGKFEEAANKWSKIVTLVEWGVRLIACASPPAIGCLWNLAISALQAAFGLLIQTCWFTKKVYAPIISRVDLVRQFPSKVASHVVTAANEHIPVPSGFDPLFAPISINVSEFEVDCDGGSDGGARLTPEREAIMDLVDEIGEEKFEALLEMMMKRGAGPWVLLTPDRIRALADPLKKIPTSTLKDLADDPSSEAPASLEEFLESIAEYTPQENRVRKRYFEEKAKREAAKAAAEGKGTGKTPDGTGGNGSTTGGAETGGGVQVLNGREHTISAGKERTEAVHNIQAYVRDASLSHAKTAPDAVTVEVYVSGTLRYRVNDVAVRATFGGTFLAVPKNYHLVIYYLKDGLQLTVDGKTVFWEQLQWSRLAEE